MSRRRRAPPTVPATHRSPTDRYADMRRVAGAWRAMEEACVHEVTDGVRCGDVPGACLARAWRPRRSPPRPRGRVAYVRACCGWPPEGAVVEGVGRSAPPMRWLRRLPSSSHRHRARAPLAFVWERASERSERSERGGEEARHSEQGRAHGVARGCVLRLHRTSVVRARLPRWRRRVRECGARSVLRALFAPACATV